MTGAPPSVTTESILTEFPALTPDTAEDFADRIRQPPQQRTPSTSSEAARRNTPKRVQG